VTAAPRACGGAAAKLPETAVPATVDKSAYAEIYRKNVFDSKRQPWAVKSEAPPETSVTPITPADAEVYGVMMFGDYKKAISAGQASSSRAAQEQGCRAIRHAGRGRSLGPYRSPKSTRRTLFASGVPSFPWRSRTRRLTVPRVQ
jgi:hypothetical protein